MVNKYTDTGFKALKASNTTKKKMINYGNDIKHIKKNLLKESDLLSIGGQLVPEWSQKLHDALSTLVTRINTTEALSKAKFSL